ncbi:MAG TPA: ABC transporter permease [Firmicutes bacterium]|jgi:sulfonate transport system permease protein|nr:ABC transporter permease [Bacillota bacterium]
MENVRESHWQGLVFPGGILVLWFLLAYTGKLNRHTIPSPGEMISAFGSLCRDGVLWSYLSTSLWRVLSGFVLAAMVGVPLGLIMGCFPQTVIWFGPTLAFLRQIPPTALIPLFLLWLGIGEGSKLAVIFYAALFPIVVNSCLGVQEISRDYWEVSRALCLPPWNTLRRLILPGSLEAVFTGLRLGMGLSWRAIVAAEMLASTSGLGYLVMTARSLARVDQMFVGIAVIGFMGLVMDQAFLTVHNRLILPRRGVRHASTPPQTAPSLQNVS